MTDDEIRSRWTKTRDQIVATARHTKQVQSALGRLAEEYEKLDQHARRVVDELLATWILSSDESERFEARVLAKEKRIVTLLPALRELALQLQSTASHTAPFELLRVYDVIKALE